MKRKCDFCDSDALYDAPTENGPWAYMCYAHYLIKANLNFPPTLLANIKE